MRPRLRRARLRRALREDFIKTDQLHAGLALLQALTSSAGGSFLKTVL
jgi:hypothetical protein